MTAYEENAHVVSVNANTDLSTYQHRFVKLTNASGEARLVVCGDGEDAFGVLTDKPNAAGIPGRVAVGGIVKVQAGGAFNAGVRVSSGANGKVNAVGTGDKVLGWAMKTSSGDGHIVPVLFAPIG